MRSTRCGISAKQLVRELGVHCKTAWRMFNRIRTELMTDEGEPQLRGKVEADETSWGGKPRRKFKDRREVAAFRESRTTVLGMIERGGRVRLRVIASRRGEPLSGAVRTHVNPAAFMLTDDWPAYKPLRREYARATINHSAGIYAEGDIHTNTIEGFFGNLKTGMRGIYKHVSDRGCSPTWTSTRGATITLGRVTARCPITSWTRRPSNERGDAAAEHQRRGEPPEQCRCRQTAGDRRPTRLRPSGAGRDGADHEDRF